MPYFERKPWREMAKESAKAPLPNTLMAEDECGIADIARQVLSAASGPQQALEGPYRCRDVLTPGQRGSVTLEVSADINGGAMSLELAPGDLRDQNGAVIPADKIGVLPKHIDIAPGSSAQFVVEVLVPPDAKPGLYSGRVIGSGQEPVNFLIEIEVGQSKE